MTRPASRMVASPAAMSPICRTCTAQTTGYYTNNASFSNGTSWSLFAFGANTCTQIAQYSVMIERAQCTGDLDGSGVIDGADLGVMLGNWGACPRAGAPEPANLSTDH